MTPDTNTNEVIEHDENTDDLETVLAAESTESTVDGDYTDFSDEDEDDITECTPLDEHFSYLKLH
jgi:hypothetical protein